MTLKKKVVILLCNDIKLSGLFRALLEHSSSLKELTCCCPLAPSAGEKTEFQMEELRKITNVGAKTPVYILCLTELKRLVHVGGTKNASVYKLCTQK